MEKNKLVMPLAALALVLSAGGGVIAAAHADSASTTSTSTSTQAPDTQGSRPKPAAIGEVTAISGNTITLTDKMSGTTYTIDASSATIEKHAAPSTTGTQPKAPTTISVSGIAIGDTLMVQGTVNGNSITATEIHDGMPFGHGGRGHGVHGTVTAVNGSTLTVTSADGTTYTVDASSATASKIQTMSVGDVTVGDSINVDGTISGSTITAQHLMDGVPQGGPQDTTTSS